MDLRTQKSGHIRTYLNSWVHSGVLPCVMMNVIEGEEEQFFHAIGNANCEENTAVARDTIFRIYSMTKPIVSVAFLILVERGLIGLDDLLSKWIPEFANQMVVTGGTIDNPTLESPNTPITIRHILTHTSGISYGIFGNSLCDQLLRKNLGPEHAMTWYRNIPLADLCRRIANSPLHFHPGAFFMYGLNTDVLGHIIELVSGVALNVFLNKELFAPLGMVDTGFVVPPENLSRLSSCYEVAPGHNYKLSTNFERCRSEPPTLLAGGGGLVSTLDDYSKFVKFLLRRGASSSAADATQIISTDMLHVMMSNHLPEGKDIIEFSYDNSFSESIGAGIGFGLGVAVVIEPSKCRGGQLSGRGESGWGGVATTSFLVDPVNNMAAIFLTQVIPSSAYPIRAQVRWLSHWLLQDDLTDL